MATSKRIPANWEKWCKTGIHGHGTTKKNAVMRCLKNGHVRGYFSDIVLRPDTHTLDSMYPTLEHLNDPNDHDDAAVEACIFNQIKSHLSEKEFWQVIEHFFAVGVEKGAIKPPFGKRLPRGWAPKRNASKGNLIQSNTKAAAPISVKPSENSPATLHNSKNLPKNNPLSS